MKRVQVLGIAAEALGRNRLRSALTSLGIIIGVARGDRHDGASARARGPRSNRGSAASAPT